jgi:hypothetical protein
VRKILCVGLQPGPTDPNKDSAPGGCCGGVCPSLCVDAYFAHPTWTLDHKTSSRPPATFTENFFSPCPAYRRYKLSHLRHVRLPPIIVDRPAIIASITSSLTFCGFPGALVDDVAIDTLLTLPTRFQTQPRNHGQGRQDSHQRCRHRPRRLRQVDNRTCSSSPRLHNALENIITDFIIDWSPYLPVRRHASCSRFLLTRVFTNFSQ